MLFCRLTTSPHQTNVTFLHPLPEGWQGCAVVCVLTAVVPRINTAVHDCPLLIPPLCGCFCQHSWPLCCGGVVCPHGPPALLNLSPGESRASFTWQTLGVKKNQPKLLTCMCPQRTHLLPCQPVVLGLAVGHMWSADSLTDVLSANFSRC